MLDLKLIRSEPERIKAALARRGAAEKVDELLALDERRRQLLPEIEGARSERKQESEKIASVRRAEAGYMFLHKPQSACEKPCEYSRIPK